MVETRMNTLKNMTLTQGVVLALLCLFAVAPVLTEALDQSFFLSLATRVVILSIAAVSLNLILGYGGMVSFGHAAFIGIGAYAVGIPAYYEVYNGFYQIAIAIGVAALFALITGAISLRTKGVYFIMITMAFGQMAFYALVSIEEYGGDDGLVIETRSEFPNLLSIENNVVLYYVCFVFLLATIYLVHRIINSRFGMVVRGCKSNERRMQAVGYNTYLYKLTCYVIAGAICGFSGALLGNFTSFISPEMMDWTRSGELMFMIILGGTGSLFGPFIGTIFYLMIEEVLSDITIYWQLIFGALLILLVLFAPGGISGLLKKWEAK